jgi:hypothetical protein
VICPTCNSVGTHTLGCADNDRFPIFVVFRKDVLVSARVPEALYYNQATESESTIIFKSLALKGFVQGRALLCQNQPSGTCRWQRFSDEVETTLFRMTDPDTPSVAITTQVTADPSPLAATAGSRSVHNPVHSVSVSGTGQSSSGHKWCPIHELAGHDLADCKCKNDTSCKYCKTEFLAGHYGYHVQNCTAMRCHNCDRLGHVKHFCKRNLDGEDSASVRKRQRCYAVLRPEQRSAALAPVPHSVASTVTVSVETQNDNPLQIL